MQDQQVLQTQRLKVGALMQQLPETRRGAQSVLQVSRRLLLRRHVLKDTLREAQVGLFEGLIWINKVKSV